ncbi:acyltransferase [Paraburkholderia sp. J67]|uniref:acyltransferase family protein n=1 Tax=Paraburkholderia sp. J67 TaxID=2805435 RepID=UPI002ABD86E1|nr:acyltransferase [Paraburkholderia sp. J67]
MLFSIQYMRGLAAIFVLIYHASHKQVQIAGFGNEWSFGASGVDLFFIISGFIMCHVTAHKNIAPREFLVARCTRILPLYWSLSLFALAVYLIEPGMINSSGGTTTILNSFTLIPTGDKFLIQNGWTLSYEFLFYFIFSASLLKWCENRLLFVTITMTCFTAVGDFLHPTNPTLQFVTSKMLLEFLMGIVAHIYIKSERNNSKFSVFLIVIGIAIMTLGSLSASPNQRVVWYGLPYALLFSGLVSLENTVKFVSTSLIGRAMRIIGDASYSIYLSHPFVLSTVGIILKRFHMQSATAFSIATMTITSVAAGYVCYIVVETNLNRLARKITAHPATIRDSAPSQT